MSKRTHTAQFTTTRWTVVLAAGQQDTGASQAALESLCQTYWFPLYAYLRRRGYPKEQAEDYTQGFFVHVLEKRSFRKASPENCRFRTYLLSSLKNYVTDQWRAAQTQKRGKGKQILPFDVEDAETRYSLDPGDPHTPESFFERSWALTVLEHAMERLQSEYAHRGKSQQFEHLKGHLVGKPDNASYGQMAAALNMTESAARVAAHRLRLRLRAFVRAEVAQTVATPDAVEDELRDLFAALTR